MVIALTLENTSTETGEVSARVDVSRYWPKDNKGADRSFYYVLKQIKGTPLNLNQSTLQKAKEGNYRSGDFSHLVKLARLCSQWSGQTVTVDDILVLEDSNAE